MLSKHRRVVTIQCNSNLLLTHKEILTDLCVMATESKTQCKHVAYLITMKYLGKNHAIHIYKDGIVLTKTINQKKNISWMFGFNSNDVLMADRPAILGYIACRWVMTNSVYVCHDDVIKWSFCRVTGPLCGEFTGHRWIPLTKSQWRGALMFLWCWSEQIIRQTVELLVIWDAMTSIVTSL